VPFDLTALLGQLDQTAAVAGRSQAVEGLRKRRLAQAAESRTSRQGLIAAAMAGGLGGAQPAGGGGGGHDHDHGGTPTSNGPGKGMTWITLPNGGRVQVAANYAGKFGGLLNDLWNAGYKFKSVGGYNYRNIAGTNRLSKHATGEAIDIDPHPNRGTRLGGGGNPYGYFDPAVAIKLARKWGLDWGGTWKGSEDPMHFSTGG